MTALITIFCFLLAAMGLDFSVDILRRKLVEAARLGVSPHFFQPPGGAATDLMKSSTLITTTAGSPWRSTDKTLMMFHRHGS